MRRTVTVRRRGGRESESIGPRAHYASNAFRAAAWCALLLAGVATGPGFAADGDTEMAQGRQLFTETASPPCALCHTLADAGSSGEIGPVLDDLKPDAERVASALRTGLGAMPSYQSQLSKVQIETLAHYVSHASGGAK
jgi:cytochrome c6